MSDWLTVVLWMWAVLGFSGFTFAAMLMVFATPLSKKEARFVLFFVFGALCAPLALPLSVIYVLTCGARQFTAVARKADLPELLPPVSRGHKEIGGGQLSMSNTQGGELSTREGDR